MGILCPSIPLSMPTFVKPKPQKIGWIVYEEVGIHILNDKAFECLRENFEMNR